MRSLLVFALFAGLAASAPADAGTPELRLWIARLIESVDAGLTRAELRQLRIEINAEIRVESLAGANKLAELDELVRDLVAADTAAAILVGLPACQAPKPGEPAADAETCLAQVRPHLQVLNVRPPEAGTPLSPAALMQSVLATLRRQAERSLRNLV